MDVADAILGAVPERPARWRLGVCVDVPAGRKSVTVQVDGVTVTVPKLTSYIPQVDDGVLLLVLDGTRMYAVGSFTAHNAAATIPSTPPPPPAAPPPPPPPPETGTTTFTATGTDTYRGSWKGPGEEVKQGEYASYGQNTGLWFYGTKIATTLSGRTCERIRMRLDRVRAGVFAAQAINLYLHPYVSRPTGGPTLTGSPYSAISLPVGGGGWFDLPLSYGQALINGTSRGLGITGSPYLALAPLTASGESGALQITWRR